MVVGSVSGVYGVYQPKGHKTAERVTRAEEKRDYVALSTQAKDFANVRKALTKVSDIREDKVTDIRSKVEKDEYAVSASDIADKIVSRFFG